MFRDLSEDELLGIGLVSIERKYEKKQIIFHEGGEKEAVFFIQEGLVKTFKTDENGHEQIMSFLKSGDMFPHTGLFDAEPYPATAEAIVETVLLAIPVKSFEQQLLRTPAIAMKIMRVMSEKIRELQGKLQELTGHDVQDRGQSFLLKLAEHYGTMKGGEVHIAIPMTHQDVANVIGTTRETVNRLLNQLRKEGILDTDRQGFVIHDLEGLRRWKNK
ncbi:Crp/Fnr family transcriptional regulator [Paenibacillus antri]|uniref:Crp/Fnr family transcriptional regulator n=2 Tax=Paenibacillus antri TaxID=2582848 RepID=A0A5R9G6W8_9BACL|nr:Crp/Fnr family transcriptional regulator [Paenibacillus antri]